MAQKGQEKGVTGPAPVVDDPGRVRNVVLVGHSGAGKTTLVEALLAATGTIARAGSVTEGTTVCDHDPAAVKQQRSVSLACAPLLHDGVKVNLLDTPGYADFVGELRAGLRAADAALFVVSAVDGMDAATAALWEECAAVGHAPRGGDLPARPPAGRLRRDRGAVPAGLRRADGGAAALPADARRRRRVGGRPDRPDHPAGLRLLRRATRRRCASPTPSTCRRSRRPATS